MPRSNWDSVSIAVLLIGTVVLCCVLFVDTVFADTFYFFEGSVVYDTRVDVEGFPLGSRTTDVELNANWFSRRRWKNKSKAYITIDVGDTRLANITTAYDTMTCQQGVDSATIRGIYIPANLCK